MFIKQLCCCVWYVCYYCMVILNKTKTTNNKHFLYFIILSFVFVIRIHLFFNADCKWWRLMMAGRTPGRKSSGALSQGRLPASPLGATPRPPLRQVYPKPPQGSFLSEYELSELQNSYAVQAGSVAYDMTLLLFWPNAVSVFRCPLVLFQ